MAGGGGDIGLISVLDPSLEASADYRPPAADWIHEVISPFEKALAPQKGEEAASEAAC